MLKYLTVVPPFEHFLLASSILVPVLYQVQTFQNLASKFLLLPLRERRQYAVNINGTPQMNYNSHRISPLRIRVAHSRGLSLLLMPLVQFAVPIAEPFELYSTGPSTGSMLCEIKLGLA